MDERITHSKEETQAFAQTFAKTISGGIVLSLYGNLGSGKTTFVQGLAKGLGITRRIISPTFIMVRTYTISSKYQVSGIMYLYHIDLYRTETKQDLKGLGIEEILQDKNAVVAIEWAEKLGNLLPEKRIDIHFEDLGGEKRRITIKMNQES